MAERLNPEEVGLGFTATPRWLTTTGSSRHASVKCHRRRTPIKCGGPKKAQKDILAARAVVDTKKERLAALEQLWAAERECDAAAGAYVDAAVGVLTDGYVEEGDPRARRDAAIAERRAAMDALRAMDEAAR